MDPKNLNQLDPKIKEAYDRVMGTDLTSPQTPSEPAAPQFGAQTIPSAPEPAKEYAPPPPPPIHLDTSQAPETPVTPPPVFQSFNSETASQPTSPAPEAVAVHHSSRFAISTPILMVLGIAFFIAYAALWVMVFGIKLF